MSIHRIRRSIAAALGLALAAAVVEAFTISSPAAAAYERPTVQQEHIVKGGTVAARPSVPNPAASRAVVNPPPARWPGAASADVQISAGFDPKAPAPRRVGDLPVQVSAGADTTAPARQLRVRVLDGTTTARAGRPEVLLRVTRTDGGSAATPVDLALDYRAFRTAYGADWSNRLRLVQLPECALTTPEQAGCAGNPVASRNLVTGWVTGPVTAAPSQSEGGLYALSASASGSSGSFEATKLSPSSTWTAGGNAGNFSWSYPLRTPPSLGGPAPSFALDYSAQSVDGRHAATNNQPSWVGEGFELWSGAVERRYKPCSEDLGGNNGQTKTGDLCWATSNALLNLGGQAVELIRDDRTGAYRLRDEDGTKIEHLTDANNGNGDNTGEYWKVTAQDGTQYFFGLNKLPGWTSGAATTRSVWTVPVYGNNSGEPCHASTFDASYCSQAWRWNLDYVVDTHGNTMSFWYTPETNKYARNLTGSKVSTYTRGGTLTRADYGTRNTTAYGTPPMRVLFGTADRCLSNCTTHGANWPDTPWDQNCASTATSCDDYSPTFWSTKRLSTVTTQVLKNGALTTVDSWTLKHTFPDPGDSTRAGLWLDAIARTGVPSDVTFVGIQLDNRVDTTDFAPAMKWWRVSTIRTEFGGDISITYSAKDCVAGTRVPTDPESNTLRCYPSKWTPSGYTQPIQDYFHKYVVDRVDEFDLSGGGTRVSNEYVYLGTPAWHYVDEDGLLPTSKKTWSGWRGYQRVMEYRGDGADRSATETLYFRGMHGDKLPTGTRSVSIVDSEGASQTDHDAFAGMAREQITYNGPGGPVVEAAISDPWQSNPTASRTIDGTTVYARYVDTAVERTRVALDGGRGWRRTRVETAYTEYGMPLTVNDLGDEAKTGDERCTRNTYLHNTTAWLMSTPARTQVDALTCDKTPSSGDDVISDQRFYYDGQAYGLPPTKGDVTKLEALHDWVNGTRQYHQVSRAGYDVHGRVIASYDPDDRLSTTSFTPSAGAPVTGTTITNPLGHTTTTDYDPAWSLPTAITDANSRITELQYDSLGRLTAVWLPGRLRANGDTPSAKYDYRLPARLTDGQPDGVVVRSTMGLGPNGSYVTSYELFDGLLRSRQTQAPAGDGSADRIVTDTLYDSAGRPYKANAGYVVSGAAAPTLFAPAGGDDQIAAQVLTLYDGADRPTAEILRSFGAEKWRTTTGYGGDRVDVTPPNGGTVTSTVTDARGNTVELRQYRDTTPGGEYDATGYTYNRKNQLARMTDPENNVWVYGYDMRGRKEVINDPDKGVSRLVFDNTDHVASSTDQRGRTLAFTYDDLGRQVAIFEGSTAGPKLAEWTYDTVTGGRGLAASSTRFVGTTAYRSEIRGYDTAGRSTGTKITIPAAEGKLAGAYTFGMTYHVNGSPRTVSLPAVAGLPREVLEYSYDNAGKPIGLANSINLVTGTYVESTQYTKLGEAGVHTFATSSTDKLVQQGFTYDESTRRLIRSRSTKETSTAALADTTYTWDPAGNITKMADAAAGDTQCFEYDGLRRLTEAWTPAGSDCTATRSGGILGGPAPYWHSFAYHPTGNRRSFVRHGATTAQDETTTYAYPQPTTPQPHTLLSRSTATGTGQPATQTYDYDETGNTTSRPGPSGQQQLTWDIEGRLASVTDPAGTTAYLYDPGGQRLIRRDPSATTLYLPGTEVRHDKASDTVTATRFYSYRDATVAQRTAAGVTWLLPDHQNTANISVAATAQQAVTIRRQTPFGEPRGTAGAWPNSHGFLDGTNDPTGTVHLGAREYDPGTGRFLSVDPVIDPTSPQTLNGYAYAENSPVTFSDPTGLARTADNEGRVTEHNYKKKAPRKKNPRKTKYGLNGKYKGGRVIVARGYVGIVVKLPCGGVCRAKARVIWLGPQANCPPGASFSGPCFKGSDGNLWDVYGNNLDGSDPGCTLFFLDCQHPPARELPDPIGYSNVGGPPPPPPCVIERQEPDEVIRAARPPSVIGLLVKGPQNWTPTDVGNLAGAAAGLAGSVPAPLCPACGAATLILTGFQFMAYAADGNAEAAARAAVEAGASALGGRLIRTAAGAHVYVVTNELGIRLARPTEEIATSGLEELYGHVWEPVPQRLDGYVEGLGLPESW